MYSISSDDNHYIDTKAPCYLVLNESENMNKDLNNFHWKKYTFVNLNDIGITFLFKFLDDSHMNYTVSSFSRQLN